MYVALGNDIEFGRWPTREEAARFVAIQRRKIKGAGLAKNPVTDIARQSLASRMSWVVREVK